MGPHGRAVFDVVLVVALALPVVSFPVIGLFPVETGLALLQILPLLARRPHPVATFAAVALFSALQAAVIDTPLWSQLAFAVATYFVARYSTALWSWLTLAVGICGAVVAAFDWIEGYGGTATPSTISSYFLTVATIVVTSWALGTAGRTRQAYVDALVERGRRLANESAQRAELAAAESAPGSPARCTTWWRTGCR